MAKDKNNGQRSKWNIRRGLEDMRSGLDEDARDANNMNLAKMARVLGFSIAIAAILYLIGALRSFGIFS